MWELFFPERASTQAGQIDSIYYAVTGLALLFAVPIAFLLIFFAIRYRRSALVDRFDAVGEGRDIGHTFALETTWIVVPLFLALGVFTWGARLYVAMNETPANAMEIYVVAKQWMWKYQHPTGQTEIDELHVPVGYPVRLTMVSEDVIHSFYVPAFRVKQDVLPAVYTTIWFEATKVGEYRIFCTEYCGTGHSDMIGRIIVMEPRQYQEWISSRGLGGGTGVIPEDQTAGQAAGESGAATMADAGAQLFSNLGCAACHLPDGNGAGPSLVGLWGEEVRLADGQTVVADISYIRSSILDPQAQIVEGYAPIMPTYAGQIDEEELLTLIEYIRVQGNGSENNATVPEGADTTESGDVTGPSTIQGEQGGTGESDPVNDAGSPGPSEPTGESAGDTETATEGETEDEEEQP